MQYVVRYGSAIEAFEKDGDRFAKVFILDADVLSKNRWGVTDQAMLDGLRSFVGKPVLGPPGDPMVHGVDPKTGQSLPLPELAAYEAAHQVGTIIEVGVSNGIGWGIAKITSDAAWAGIKDGSWRWVSPQIRVDTSDIQHTPSGGEMVQAFVGRHVAFVDNPAFGGAASVKGTCVSPDVRTCNFSAALNTVMMRGFMFSKFVAVLDGRTCDECEDLDGTSWLQDAVPDEDAPPIHPNCRCDIEDYEASLPESGATKKELLSAAKRLVLRGDVKPFRRRKPSEPFSARAKEPNAPPVQPLSFAESMDKLLAAADSGGPGSFPWQDCIDKMMKQYGDMDTAKKVCAAIKSRSAATAVGLGIVGNRGEAVEMIAAKVKADPLYAYAWGKLVEFEASQANKSQAGSKTQMDTNEQKEFDTLKASLGEMQSKMTAKCAEVDALGGKVKALEDEKATREANDRLASVKHVVELKVACGLAKAADAQKELEAMKGFSADTLSVLAATYQKLIDANPAGMGGRARSASVSFSAAAGDGKEPTAVDELRESMFGRSGQ